MSKAHAARASTSGTRRRRRPRRSDAGRSIEGARNSEGRNRSPPAEPAGGFARHAAPRQARRWLTEESEAPPAESRAPNAAHPRKTRRREESAPTYAVSARGFLRRRQRPSPVRSERRPDRGN